MEYTVVLAVILLPILVFACLKFGTYGYFTGRDLASKTKEARTTASKSKEDSNE